MKNILWGTSLLLWLFTSLVQATPLRLATTTSTRDSGLLDVLVSVFEKTSTCRVDVIAVGTGAALKLGESGDVDAVLVHAHVTELTGEGEGHQARPSVPRSEPQDDAEVAELRAEADGQV